MAAAQCPPANGVLFGIGAFPSLWGLMGGFFGGTGKGRSLGARGGRPLPLAGPRPTLRTNQRSLLVHPFDLVNMLRSEKDSPANPDVRDLTGVAETT